MTVINRFGAFDPDTFKFFAADQGGAATMDRETGDDNTNAAEGADNDEQRVTFASLGLSDELLQSITAVGFETPTPIQERTIPSLLAGNDVIAQAQTGSGKTGAFGLPIIENIDQKRREVQALVLCPTRELAMQVAQALEEFGRHKRVETLAIYGGQPYERQLRGLQRGVHIVVGTPGRVMDHMRRGTLALDALDFFVLDEADEMLDMGFVEDIEWVLQHAPEERQTALFSATMPPRIAELATKYMNEPHRISVRGKEMTVAEIEQTYYEVPHQRKVDALTRILDAEVPSSAMIFCRTKHMVDQLGEALLGRGYAVETIHGDLSQAQRDRVMRRFRTGQAEILIATDVAARGLDIPDVSHVINFDVPESPETYVHRIGRTGRAGKAGKAITLVTRREVRSIRTIERVTKAKIQYRPLPSAADVNKRRREMLKQLVSDAADDREDYEAYLEPVRELTDGHDAVELAAAILKLYAEETGRAATDETEQDELARASNRPSAERGVGGGRARGAESGMTRLFINIGHNFRVRPQDFVGAIANEAKIPGRAIGAIDIHDTFSFVDVPENMAEQVIDAMNAASVKGRPVNVEVASDGAGARGDRRGPRRS
ncbi:MAG: DEAD/DEAH box helicase, partial [Chloroflexota bacterium]|nr:DEAD/DEAH box helicase [Chloroflexota bacterium]